MAKPVVISAESGIRLRKRMKKQKQKINNTGYNVYTEEEKRLIMKGLDMAYHLIAEEMLQSHIEYRDYVEKRIALMNTK